MKTNDYATRQAEQEQDPTFFAQGSDTEHCHARWKEMLKRTNAKMLDFPGILSLDFPPARPPNSVNFPDFAGLDFPDFTLKNLNQ